MQKNVSSLIPGWRWHRVQLHLHRRGLLLPFGGRLRVHRNEVCREGGSGEGGMGVDGPGGGEGGAARVRGGCIPGVVVVVVVVVVVDNDDDDVVVVVAVAPVDIYS